MKIICIFHSRDLDGWCSGAIVKKWCEKKKYELELIPWDYGQEIPLQSIGNPGTGEILCDALFICDVSFPKDIMEGLYHQGVNIVWCDHHDSALKDAEGMEYEKCDGIRSKDFAGCELTWNYCFPDIQMPMGVEFLGKYDSRRDKGDSYEEEILQFQYAARAYITDVNNVPEFILSGVGYDEKMEEWVEDGAVILMYVTTDAIETYKKHKFTVEIDGHKAVCVPKERFNPVNYGIDYQGDGYEIAMCFWFKPSDNIWEFSLYSETVDVSEIAKEFGGGGHRGAAGFTVKNIYDIISEPSG